MSDAAEEENIPEDENRSEDATVEEEKPWHRWTSWVCWGNKESENYDVTGVGVFTSVVLTLVAFGVVTCGTIARFYSLEFTLAFFYLITGLSGFATISKYTWTILIFMVTCFLSTLLSLGACANFISVLAHGTRLLNCYTRCSQITVPTSVSVILTFCALLTALRGTARCGMSLWNPNASTTVAPE
ncbi:uncharacterized protein LOC129263392 [Lytechinus pictus]|uniref:uncharacterized protein LOC129263392 n=1 Tax=Lytechinus pictus TaxID=7653 RepID=UPI0030B9DF46